MDDIYEAEEAQRLATANGVIDTTEVVDLQVSALEEVVAPCVLRNSPAVLNIGRRCMEEGCEFRWKPGSNPYFIRPDGVRVDFEVDAYVPYFVENPDGDPGESSDNSKHSDVTHSVAAKGGSGSASSSSQALPEQSSAASSGGSGVASGDKDASSGSDRVADAADSAASGG